MVILLLSNPLSAHCTDEENEAIAVYWVVTSAVWVVKIKNQWGRALRTVNASCCFTLNHYERIMQH